MQPNARQRGPTHQLRLESKVGSYLLPVYLAETDKEQAAGLQLFEEEDLLDTTRTASIGAGPAVRGLAFPFDSPGPHRFHMGDVKFPIDIVWVFNNRIARIVTANPGDRETWAGRGQLVFETPAGALAACHLTEGDYVHLLDRDPTGLGQNAETFSNPAGLLFRSAQPLAFRGRERLTAQLANAEAAQEAAAEGRPQLEDPSALVRTLLEYALDPDPEGRPIDPFLDDSKWSANLLTGGKTYSYVIDGSDIKRWAIGSGVPEADAGTVAQAALSRRGLLSIGDTLMALGLVDSAEPSDYGLVVFRRGDDGAPIDVPVAPNGSPKAEVTPAPAPSATPPATPQPPQGTPQPQPAQQTIRQSALVRSGMPMPTGLPAGWTIPTPKFDAKSHFSPSRGLVTYELLNQHGRVVATCQARRMEPIVTKQQAVKFRPGDIWEISSVTALDEAQFGRGWGAFLQDKVTRDVSAAGGMIASDYNLSQSGQRFWDRLHEKAEKDPSIERAPYPRRIERNFMDKARATPADREEATKVSLEPPPSTQFKYRYRVTAESLDRTAGRLRIPRAVLDPVWAFVQSVATAIRQSPRKQRAPAVRKFPLSLLAESTPYPQVREWLANSEQKDFSVLVRPKTKVDTDFGQILPGTWTIEVYVDTRMAPTHEQQTTEHELIHLHQLILGYAVGNSDMGGMPGRNLRLNKNLTALGVSLWKTENGAVIRARTPDELEDQMGGTQMLPHGQRDIEFYTNLGDEIHEFVESYNSAVQKGTARSLREEINQTIKWMPRFKMQKGNQARYQKMVREFVRGVTEALASGEAS